MSEETDYAKPEKRPNGFKVGDIVYRDSKWSDYEMSVNFHFYRATKISKCYFWAVKLKQKYVEGSYIEDGKGSYHALVVPTDDADGETIRCHVNDFYDGIGEFVMQYGAVSDNGRHAYNVYLWDGEPKLEFYGLEGEHRDLQLMLRDNDMENFLKPLNETFKAREELAERNKST